MKYYLVDFCDDSCYPEEPIYSNQYLIRASCEWSAKWIAVKLARSAYEDCYFAKGKRPIRQFDAVEASRDEILNWSDKYRYYDCLQQGDQLTLFSTYGKIGW